MRTAQYRAVRHSLYTKYSHAGWLIHARGTWQQSYADLENTDFLRPRLDIQRNFGHQNRWQIGAYTESERNLRKAADTLSSQSFAYFLTRFYVNTQLDSNISVGASYQRRRDWLPEQANLVALTDAAEWSLNGRWEYRQKQVWQCNLTRRDLAVFDTTRTTLVPQSTYLGRVNYSARYWNDAVTLHTIYELGAGQEQRVAWEYRQVAAGLGDYIWEDDGDGSIEQNEVRPTTPATRAFADVVRFTSLTNAFVKTQNLLLTQSLLFEPYSVIKGKLGIHTFLRQMALRSSLTLNRRVQAGSGLSAWNPFAAAKENLVAIQANQQHVLQLWRGSIRQNLQVGYTATHQRSLLLTGFDERENTENFVRWQWNIAKKINLTTQIARYNQRSEADSLLFRTFELQGWRVEPQLSWIPTRTARVSLMYKFKTGQNQLGANEQATLHDIGAEGGINRSAMLSVRAKFALVQTMYSGEAGTAAAFALLEGFQPGRNYVWQLGLDRTFGRSFQLNFVYEGRYARTGRTLHTGTAQAKVIF